MSEGEYTYHDEDIAKPFVCVLNCIHDEYTVAYAIN